MAGRPGPHGWRKECLPSMLRGGSECEETVGSNRDSEQADAAGARDAAGTSLEVIEATAANAAAAAGGAGQDSSSELSA